MVIVFRVASQVMRKLIQKKKLLKMFENDFSPNIHVCVCMIITRSNVVTHTKYCGSSKRSREIMDLVHSQKKNVEIIWTFYIE